MSIGNQSSATETSGDRISRKAGESPHPYCLISYVRIGIFYYQRIGSITLSVVRNDDADQRELEWIQSSLLFALRILPAHAALSLDVAVVG